jgi:hypothetical protein
MMIKKKDRFKSKSGKVYEIAGRWGQDFILAPVDKTEKPPRRKHPYSKAF